VAVLVAVVVGFLLWPRGAKQRATTGAASTSGVAVGRSGVAGSASAQKAFPAWFARPGAKPRRIAGRVTLDDKPVAGAKVTLSNQLVHAGAGEPTIVTTGADGHFDLGEWPIAFYGIAAEAPDAQTFVDGFDLGDSTFASDSMTIRLRRCDLRVSGVVTDANTTPIADATIQRSQFVIARTNARGEYSACVGYGELELDYSADGYGAVAIGFDILGSVTQDVVLVPAASVTGHVVRASDGAPVDAAMVSVFPQEWGRDHPGPRSAITDASGAFRIDGLTPGNYRTWAQADGLAQESPQAVQAVVGSTNDVTVKLVALAHVKGVVMRGDKPVSHVKVTAVRKAPTARSRPAWTQDDGTFDLDAVPVGDNVFSVEGYEVTAPAIVHIDKPGLVENVTVQVAAMASIHGIITRNKVPVEGARVCCINVGNGDPTAMSDATGHYKLEGVPPGSYQLNAGSEEIGAFTIAGKFAIAAGEDKTLDFELDLAGEIEGTVVDADGKPVKGVFVRWINEKTQDEGRGTTDAQGHYRCRAMAGGGVYRAAVYPRPESRQKFPPAPGTSYPSRDVKDGTTKIEGVTIAIDMKQMTISGTVSDSNGTAIADAVVRALPVDDGRDPQFMPWQKLVMTATDADGNFTLSGVLPGTYALQARSTDGGEAVVNGIQAGATGVAITMTRPGSITGTLTGYTQPPVIYATPWNAPNKLSPGSVTGTTFRIPAVKPGRYVVNAQTAYEGDAKTVEVRAGEATKVDLVAKGRGSIEANVFDFKTHEPIAGAICRSVMAVDGQEGLTNWDTASAPKSDERGRVIIDPAPAGNVIVDCIAAQGQRSNPSAAITVPPNGRATASLASVELTVENPAGVGLEFLWLVVPPRVSSVVPSSSAAKAGLLPGDLIVAVDGASVDGLNGQGVFFLLVNHGIGTSFPVTYERGSARKTVTVTVEMDRQ
jgi:protocatechuate 3,4-dioxygenase beta subunit